jgi:hypothetical protein
MSQRDGTVLVWLSILEIDDLIDQQVQKVVFFFGRQ